MDKRFGNGRQGGHIILIDFPRKIAVDRNQIFISEYPYIFIYSGIDYRLMKKFGGRGTWGPAIRWTEQIAAILPVCGP